MGKKRTTRKQWLAVEVVMLLLALLSGYLLLLEFTTTISKEQLELFDMIDLFIALAFLTEFCIKLFISKKRLHFFKFHWWELLAAIPISTPFTQALRLLRLLRLVHIAEALEE